MNLKYLILFVALGYAAYTDTRKMEIPIPLFPLCCAASGVCTLIGEGVAGFPVFDTIAGAILMSAPFIIGAFFGFSGGGDILMFAAIGFVLQILALLFYSVCLAVSGILFCAVVILYSVLRHNRLKDVLKSHIPLAPIAFAAYILFLIGGMFYVYY